MANIKLGNKVYNDVHSVSMETELGETITFPRYIIGTPMNVTLFLDNWSGTTYTLKIDNYKVGNNGIQIGMPLLTDTETAQMIIECALTIPYIYFYTSSNNAPYLTIRISAVKTPTKDIPIVLFGLESTNE